MTIVLRVALTPRAQNPTGIDLPMERQSRIQALLRDYPETLFILDDHWGRCPRPVARALYDSTLEASTPIV